MQCSRILCSLLSCATLMAQNISPAARQQDLDFVSTQIPKLHPNFFYQLDPAAFEQAVSSLSGRLSIATDAEFYVGLAQLVAMAGDAHTTIYITGAGSQSLAFQMLPLTFVWLDDGIFVSSATAPYARAVGARVIAVGEMPIDQVVRQLGTVISHGNEQWLHYEVQQYLTGLQILQGLHILPVAANAPFTFQSLAGEQFTMEIAPGSGTRVTAPDARDGPMPAWLQNNAANYWYTYSPLNRLLYFRYNRCIDDLANPFASFAGRILDTVDKNPVDTLVFDLRGNTGGSSNLWGPLAQGLQSRILTLLANPQFRIYGIMDKGTFSSGMDDAIQLKEPLPPEFGALFPGIDFSHFVQVVGEPSGGRPREYGQVQPFTLPGSQVVGQYSTKYFPNPDYVPDLPSFMPDIAVSLRSNDYFARHDPAMAAILARSPAVPAAPTGDVITVNGASFHFDQGIAAGSLAAAFGAFRSTPDEVLVSGTAGAITSASARQVNFIVPSTVSTGPAAVSVRAGGQEIASGEATLSVAGPGIFIANPADPSQPGAVENADYTLNDAAHPAAVGSVVQIFATGNGAVDADGSVPVQVYFADLPARVVFSAPLPQFPGLWQINALVPEGVRGQVPLEIIAGSLSSNGVTIFVK